MASGTGLSDTTKQILAAVIMLGLSFAIGMAIFNDMRKAVVASVAVTIFMAYFLKD